MEREAERNDVLRQMRSDISGNVSRRADTRGDIVNIVRTASDYPGGLVELLEIVHWYNGDSLPWQRVQKVVAEHFPSLRNQGRELEGTR
jgi:hypothetical protein